MIERIDLFMPPKSLYQVLHFFTAQMAEALTRSGVRCRVLEAEKNNPAPFLDALLTDPPQCTLSFNGLLPDNEGHFLSDLIKIPHIAFLVDSPHHFISLTHSNYSIITTVDRDYKDFFEGTHFKNALFVPHGVDIALASQRVNKDDQRPYDVMMLASFVDYEDIERTWKETLPESFYKALKEAARLILSTRDTSYFQAFSQAIDTQMTLSKDLDPHKLDITRALDQLEHYVNSIDKISTLKAIKDVDVHVFGQGSHKWQKFLKDHPNIILHEPVSFTEALELMKKTKILLNCRPTIKNGTHERIFGGLAAGAVVITNENRYLQEDFKHGRDILYYDSSKHEGINDLVHAYLKSPKKRYDLIDNARNVILEGHTWDHRAASLISQLNSLKISEFVR